ncbi:MAG: PDZ domain-containing protein [Bryobacterales bacterium]|nr:PDZ domain-containing protein [Bryobacteraceae bacterium]MDW8353393.1 PDZ domain-containing protein [Bryobacterales bacterium]
MAWLTNPSTRTVLAPMALASTLLAYDLSPIAPPAHGTVTGGSRAAPYMHTVALLPLDSDPDSEAATEDRAIVIRSGSRSFLGVGVAEIDAERAKALKLKEERGVEITRVEPDSPAEKAGLKKGDVVLEYNGQRVEGTEQFIRLVRETPPGRKATLLISREGQTQTVTATIGTTRDRGVFSFDLDRLQRELDRVRREAGEIRVFRIPDLPSPLMSWRTTLLGIEAESLSDQLADYFGVKEGVLVRTVLKDSPAEKAGIKAGDVITRVNDRPVDSPQELSRRLREARREQKTVTLALVRNRKEMNVTVTLEEPVSRPERPRVERVGQQQEL